MHMVGSCKTNGQSWRSLRQGVETAPLPALAAAGFSPGTDAVWDQPPCWTRDGARQPGMTSQEVLRAAQPGRVPESGLSGHPGEDYALLSIGSVMHAKLDQKIISDYAGRSAAG